MDTRDAGWHRQEIIAALRMRGDSLAALGRRIGLKRATMAWALIFPHHKANAAISDALGVPLHELWPQWFDADGTLISRAALPRPSRQPTPLRPFASRHRREAA